MRQTLTKGLVVAAAATGALSLCGGWAFADSDPYTTGADSYAALADDVTQWDFPGASSAEKAMERADSAMQMAREMTEKFSAPNYTTQATPSRTSSSGNDGGSNYGDDDSSKKSSYGSSYGDDDSDHKSSYGSDCRDDDSSKKSSYGSNYGDDDSGHSSYGSNYGDDDSDHSSYGSNYGEDEPPKPTRAPKPPHHHVHPVHHHKPHHHRPPHHHHHHRPQMPHTGAEGTIAAMAASGALLVAGTVLYRRGKATSQR